VDEAVSLAIPPRRCSTELHNEFLNLGRHVLNRLRRRVADRSQALKQLRALHLKRARKVDHLMHKHLLAATFDIGDRGAREANQTCELLLSETETVAARANLLSELFVEALSHFAAGRQGFEENKT
jgi:hypothetical protein